MRKASLDSNELEPISVLLDSLREHLAADLAAVNQLPAGRVRS